MSVLIHVLHADLRAQMCFWLFEKRLPCHIARVHSVWTISHLFACACDCRLAASQKAKRSPKPWNYLSCGSAPLRRFCAKSVKLFCSNTKFMCFVLWWYIGLSQYNYHWTLTSHLILFARNDLNRMYPNEQAAKLNYPWPRTAYVLRPALSRTYT